MSNEIEDGGTAFPVAGQKVDFGDGWLPQEYGMTLRDYFAAKAMQGYLAGFQTKGFSISPEMQDKIAEGMYSMADAMIKARKTYQN